MAIAAKVEPAPLTAGRARPARAAGGAASVPSAVASTSAVSRVLMVMVGSCTRGTGRSAEAAVDVVGGPGVLRVLEDLRRGAGLDDAARLVLGGQEERAALGDPLGLLHVVGDDDDRHLVAQL